MNIITVGIIARTVMHVDFRRIIIIEVELRRSVTLIIIIVLVRILTRRRRRRNVLARVMGMEIPEFEQCSCKA